MSKAPSHPTLSTEEERAWRALMRLTVVLPRAIDEDLRNDSALQLTSHGVLLHLAESPDRQMRMSELADCTAMSPSRITRVVQSLSADGLVEQTPCPGDGRSSMAAITDAGVARLRAATPAHVQSLRSRVLDHIEPSRIADFADKIEALLEGIESARTSSDTLVG
jgi:DNA-binding MarR family transcriptional regulator